MVRNFIVVVFTLFTLSFMYLTITIEFTVAITIIDNIPAQFNAIIEIFHNTIAYQQLIIAIIKVLLPNLDMVDYIIAIDILDILNKFDVIVEDIISVLADIIAMFGYGKAISYSNFSLINMKV